MRGYFRGEAHIATKFACISGTGGGRCYLYLKGEHMTLFIIGLMVGSLIGFFLAALLTACGRDDE